MDRSTTPTPDRNRTVAPRRMRGVQRASQVTDAQPLEPEEEAFWAHLEECEEGRIAQEADHLFDTSFEWAA